MFLLPLAPAQAAPVFVEGHLNTSEPSSVAVECPERQAPIFASGIALFGSASPSLDLLRVTPTGAEAGWHFRGDESESVYAVAGATCVDEDAVACVHVESASTDIDREQEKSLDLVCPPDTFALGADLEVTGEAAGVVVSTHAPRGLLAPLGWRIEAGSLDGKASWGLAGSLRCVSPEVFADVTAQLLEPEVGALPDGSWVASAQIFLHAADPLDWVPLGLGARLSPGPPWGLLSFGSTSDDGMDVLEAVVSYHEGRLPDGSPPSLHVPTFLYTTEPEAFEKSLHSCLVPTLPPHVFDRFRVGAAVWYGVAGGGDGIIFLPGKGPVPVDPEPFRQAFAALPVAIVTYEDATERDVRIRELAEGLEAERTPWSVVDAAEDALDGAGVVMVAARDEVEAIKWLSEHRGALEGLSHTTLVFLQRGGEAQKLLAGW